MSPLFTQKGLVAHYAASHQGAAEVFSVYFCDRHVSPPVEAGCYLFFFLAIYFVSPFWGKVSVECLRFLCLKTCLLALRLLA